MPLESLIGHIDDLVGQINSLISNVQTVPYPRVRNYLGISGQNFVSGLRIVKEMLNEYIIKRAEIIANLSKDQNQALSVDDVIRSYWRQQVSNTYSIIERFNNDALMQAKANIPFEIYHWLLDFFDNAGLDTPIVLQQSNQFINQSFKRAIVEPLEYLIKIGKKPIIPGSLVQVKSPDILKKYPLTPGYIISYISGEGPNPLLWPVLVHEAFHIMDKEINFMGRIKKHFTSLDKKLPVLNKNPRVNSKWIEEILADVLAIHTFGPMYAYSLSDYFERAPYVQTIDHPEMSVRLYSVYQYLDSTRSNYTDILHRCVNSCKGKIVEKIDRYEKSGQLEEDEKQKIHELYKEISEWYKNLKPNSFTQTLKNYVLESRRSVSEAEKAKSEKKFVLFPNLLFDFNEIRNLLLEDRISLAINPNILLNVVLANLELYDRERHLDALVDSIKKWKVKQAWQLSINEINE